MGASPARVGLNCRILDRLVWPLDLTQARKTYRSKAKLEGAGVVSVSEHVSQVVVGLGGSLLLVILLKEVGLGSPG